MRSHRKIYISIAVLLIIIIVSGLYYWRYQVFPMQHAKSCEYTIENVANVAVHEDIPKRKYHAAVARGIYIENYYPAGAVLPKNHPYIKEYEGHRKEQMSRISQALALNLGVDCGFDWMEWEKQLDRIDKQPKE